MLVAGWLLQEEALNWQASFKARPPTEAIIFILGGSTYEEAKVRGRTTWVVPVACGACGDGSGSRSLPGILLWLNRLREAVVLWGYECACGGCSIA